MTPVALRTVRLVLTPLTFAQAVDVLSGARRPDWAQGYPTAGDRVIAGLLVAGRAADEPDEPGMWGPWVLRTRGEGVVIGGAGFHGPPRQGAVEIGYGIAAAADG